MKNILIPALLTIATTPFISMVSCKQKEPEPQEHDYANDYLTFTAIKDGDFQCDIYREDTTKEVALDLWYSINNSEWTKVEHNYVDTETFEHKYHYSMNDVIRLKGVNEYFSYYVDDVFQWTTSFHFNSLVDASGNVMSLLYGDDFKGKTDLKCKGVFCELFDGQVYAYSFPQILYANNLILPSLNLTNHCYGRMFTNCSSLVKPPKLPATNLAPDCYNTMFYNCLLLQYAPKLDATTLAKSCYLGMFGSCRQLKVEEQGNDDRIIFTCPENIPLEAVYHMFSNTGGTITTDPVANKTYYWA